MKIPVSFCTSHAMADKSILVDSGATDNFIDPRLIKQTRIGYPETGPTKEDLEY
jgi:hypothetical protein